VPFIEQERERYWERKLKIKTAGRDESAADRHKHPYEPTPYCVLERIAESGLIDRTDVLLDYGCGKGRVGIFFAAELGCKTIGVEFDRRFFEAAEKNAAESGNEKRTRFVHADAAAYSVPGEVNRCFFFNPFSVEILKKVLARILDSHYENPREILLLFYFPSEEFLRTLHGMDLLRFCGEIDCSDLFSHNYEREKVAIFKPC